MTRHHLIVGAGGLLGSSVRTVLHERGIGALSISGLNWTDVQAVNDAFVKSIKKFLDVCGPDDWSVYWCAGRATLRSDLQEANWEGKLLRNFLRVVELTARPSQLTKGSIVFASSAGGMYSSSGDVPITELATPAPTSPYGAAKQDSEQLLADWCVSHGVRLTIGRVTSLYGLNQDLTKPQGLLSHLVRAALMREPLTVYVPLSTTRNYIAAQDAAALLVRHMSRQTDPYRVANICSTENVSIATLLRMCELIVRRRIPTRLVIDAATESDVRNLRVSTIYRDEVAQIVRTPIHVGIHQLFAAAMAKHASKSAA